MCSFVIIASFSLVVRINTTNEVNYFHISTYWCALFEIYESGCGLFISEDVDIFMTVHTTLHYATRLSNFSVIS